MKTNKPKSIKTLLAPFFQSKKTEWKIKLLKEWPNIMGQLTQYVTIIKIDTDTLILGVYDSCWLQELYLLSPEILQTINQNLENSQIKKLRFKQIGRALPSKIVLQSEKTPVYAPIILTHREKMALKGIKDETLRSALQSFLIRCHRERVK